MGPARIMGWKSMGSCNIGTSASSAMELVSDAKDGVMLRVDSGSMQKRMVKLMLAITLVGVLGLWKDDGKMLRSKVSCMP